MGEYLHITKKKKILQAYNMFVLCKGRTQQSKLDINLFAYTSKRSKKIFLSLKCYKKYGLNEK